MYYIKLWSDIKYWLGLNYFCIVKTEEAVEDFILDFSLYWVISYKIHYIRLYVSLSLCRMYLLATGLSNRWVHVVHLNN